MRVWHVGFFLLFFVSPVICGGKDIKASFPGRIIGTRIDKPSKTNHRVVVVMDAMKLLITQKVAEFNPKKYRVHFHVEKGNTVNAGAKLVTIEKLKKKSNN